MAWQKCPVCNGTGKNYVSVFQHTPCRTCKGEKIISELTGLPPSKNNKDVHNRILGSNNFNSNS